MKMLIKEVRVRKWKKFAIQKFLMSMLKTLLINI